MCRAVKGGRTPNLFALSYDPERWRVLDLFLVPRFVFSLSCIERRNPLSPAARRHGHVLCNILLGNIPPDGRIPMVTGGKPVSSDCVRTQYARLRPLAEMKHDARGWTLDVLNVVRGIASGRGTPRRARPTLGTPWCAPTSFTLAEVYAQEAALARLHPENLHVRDKIRQQLQRLRDLGVVGFVARGQYRLV